MVFDADLRMKKERWGTSPALLLLNSLFVKIIFLVWT